MIGVFYSSLCSLFRSSRFPFRPLAERIGGAVFLFLSLSTSSQTPPRKAIMGLVAKPAANGIMVDSIIANGTFAALALQKADVITEINGNKISSMEAYGKNVSNIRSDEKITVQFIRNGKNMNASGNAVMRPYEQSDIADVQYDWVKFRSGYLRAITRRPKGKTNCPAILLVPGYGCGSIENYMSSYNGKLLLFSALGHPTIFFE